ncbi:hypothetical protein KIH31_08470 [Paenarthrobacter sp. DKR-5]|uniref:DNA primase family protein n=1 Tax=Paenarthrobacter sp. DKR-5 TaxID=2835535 RepID=UPI001BDDBC15|nr:phage/plasmid primase, P4 family [Paenarthrobacter sp. DKR-5]MBT1002635.1 hypothetical protein [Paenarthrobacter sp. DKR-5]
MNTGPYFMQLPEKQRAPFLKEFGRRAGEWKQDNPGKNMPPDVRTHLEAAATAATSPVDAAPTQPATGADTTEHRGQALIATTLVHNWPDKLRHVYNLGWRHWDGKRWAADEHGHAKRAVLETILSAKHKAIDDDDKGLMRDAERCESAAGIAGVLDIAAALPPYAITVADLDADPYLLNVANGTLDLRTGELRPHDPADNITKLAAAAYDPDAPSKTWDAFLARSLPDEAVRGFLQRFIGQALVGLTLEHLLAILTGTGRNGKSVLWATISAALGDYAAMAEPDLFMHRENAHPTGEMDLLGRRLVAVSESDQGRRLAEATVKRLTGGDKIRARKMRQDFVEFTPSHSVALITNHLPKVSGDDPAIWARIRVVPFGVVIPRAERDPKLPEKLHLELDAVLTWAACGWREYQAHGLAEPDAVMVATEHYQADSDALGRFLEECCETGPGLSALTEALHREWSTWAFQEGASPMGKKAFGEALEARGFPVKRGTGGIRSRLGITLKTPAYGNGLDQQ